MTGKLEINAGAPNGSRLAAPVDRFNGREVRDMTNQFSSRLGHATRAFMSLREKVTPLRPLPHPIHIVCTDLDTWPELRSGLGSDPAASLAKCTESEHVWSINTYVYLRQRGLDVRLTNRIAPGQINLVPFHYLRARDLPARAFVLGCRSDSAHPELCDMRTVLNHYCVRDARTDFVINQWMNPMLQPRIPARGATVDRISFKGTINNLAWPFQDPAFHERLRRIGVDFEVPGNLPKSELMQFWSDYRNVDVSIAIRNATWDDMKVKPPVKLVNAWGSGVPSIVGPEPVYREVRRDELDFVEVSSPLELVEAVEMLRNDPARFVRMIERGFERAADYTPDAISRQWHELLSGPVLEGFERWKRAGVGDRLVRQTVGLLQRYGKQRVSNERYLYHRDNGMRPFGPQASEQLPSATQTNTQIDQSTPLESQ